MFCYAGRTQDNNFSYHSSRGWFAVRFNSDGTVGTNVGSVELPEDMAKHWEEHGWIMFVCWMLVGYMLLASKRYASMLWLPMHYMHILMGYIVAFLTIAQGVISMRKLGGFPTYIHIHHVVGFLAFIIVPVSAFSGTATIVAGKAIPAKPWKVSTDEVQTKVGKFHRRFSYFMLFLAVIAVSSGIVEWQHWYNNKEGKFWGTINTAIGVFVPLLIEIIYRQWRKRAKLEMRDTPAKKSMSIEEFKKATFDNKKAHVILDNHIIDYSEYQVVHPGGKFVFEHNCGRDISKFFYGAYMLVNDPREKMHNHSMKAMQTAKSLVCASL